MTEYDITALSEFSLFLKCIHSLDRCTGKEKSVFDCPGWKDHTETQKECTRSTQETSVFCYEEKLEVSLIAKDTTSNNVVNGVVQIKVDGKVGTICGKSWGSLNSRVLCRSIGYIDGIMMPPRSRTGNGDILLENVACSGTEKDIFKCLHDGWNISESRICKNHNYDAAVKCFKNGRSTLLKNIS